MTKKSNKLAKVSEKKQEQNKNWKKKNDVRLSWRGPEWKKESATKIISKLQISIPSSKANDWRNLDLGSMFGMFVGWLLCWNA